jgi:glycosyltransferase involved in cell wall biosynthesis
MAKADLHVHSRYSEHPSDWFLQRLGARESYTEPEFIYRTAKEQGMDFVTVTDHNRIEGTLLLHERYPDDTFTGVETTAYFPESGSKIHTLIYGLNTAQFEMVQKLRKDIYELRAYLYRENLACSIAHATYSNGNKVTVDALERLLLLFNVFEGINGGRSRMNNNGWIEVINHLTPAHIEDLRRKYHIEPYGAEPWKKGLTGGSDDHAGLFIGKTYTMAEARTPDEFLQRLKQSVTRCGGRHNDYQSLAFTVYKVAYDFSRTQSRGEGKSMFAKLTELVFEKSSLNLRDRLKLKTLKFRSRRKGDRVGSLIVELIESFKKNTSVSQRLDLVYDKIAAVSDEFFTMMLRTFETELRRGNLPGIITSVSSSIPGIFLTLPFFTTLNHLHKSRELTEDMVQRFCHPHPRVSKRILWFTDTISDLNGVATVLKRIGWLSHTRGLHLTLVSSMDEETTNRDIPPGVMRLPYIYRFALQQFHGVVLRVPSVLNSLKMIYEYEPDEIYISTPGPVGLLGLLAAKLINAKAVGIYHNDLAGHVRSIVADSAIAEFLESFVRWFYGQMDEIKVSSQEYMQTLQNKGIERSKMKLFRHGVDYELFSPREDGRRYLAATYGIREGFTLLYAGPVTHEKNLDLLVDVRNDLLARQIDINLVIAGDGAFLPVLKERLQNAEGVYFIAPPAPENLPQVYSGVDLLVVPGSVEPPAAHLREAQSCGLPVLSADFSGAGDIIKDAETGYILKPGDVAAWSAKIAELVHMKIADQRAFSLLKQRSRDHILRTANWDTILAEMTEFTETSLRENLPV